MRYRLVPHRGGGGPGPENTAGSRHGPIERWSRIQGHREGEVVVKPNTAGASVERARCRHQKVVQNPYTALRGSAAQSSWCICPPNCLCLMGVCAALEQGLGGPTARSSWKIRKNGGWEARRFAVFFRLEYPLRRFLWRRRTGAWRPDGPI